jgi:hypothetical protein
LTATQALVAATDWIVGFGDPQRDGSILHGLCDLAEDSGCYADDIP